MIKVKEVMTRAPYIIKPTQTVMEAAKIMKENDFGVLPVGEPKAVIGVLTDRDITVRVTAQGKDAANVPVKEVMTQKFIVCNENDPIERAAELMRKHNVSRIMVSNFDTLRGIVTIADLLRNTGDRRESDKVLHHLLGRKTSEKKPKMATPGANSESCDTYDEAL